MSKDFVSGAFFAAPFEIKKTMSHLFKVGDHVKWNSEGGMVCGKIIKIHRADFDYKGYRHHADNDDPQYEIKSDKSQHIAAHKGSALSLMHKE
jgi:hypothetical protein